MTASGFDVAPLLHVAGWVVVGLILVGIAVLGYFVPLIRAKFKEARLARQREEEEGERRARLAAESSRRSKE
ncbi:MAG: hypothetical protein WA095_02605 [Minisyncoccia bacterium]